MDTHAESLDSSIEFSYLIKVIKVERQSVLASYITQQQERVSRSEISITP